MDIDSDSSSDVSDISALSDALVEEIESLLNISLTFPCPCPVCLGAGYRAKKIKDITALRQHAAIKAEERSDEMRKVKEFHQQLLSKLNKEELGTQTVQGDPAASSISPVIGGDDKQFATKIEEHKLEREQFKKKREELSDLKTKKQKILRSTTENNARSRELEEKVRTYRDTIVAQQEAMQKELQEYDQELKEKEEAKKRMLTVQEKTQEELSKLSIETEGSADDISTWGIALTQKMIACKRMKQKCNNLTEQRRRLETSMKKQAVEGKIAKKLMDALMADFEKYRNEKTDPIDEEDPVVIGVSQLTILGVDPAKLPTHCGKCRQKFKDPDARVILGICCCVDYCRTCVQTKGLIECPRHKVSVGNVMRFTMNG